MKEPCTEYTKREDITLSLQEDTARFLLWGLVHASIRINDDLRTATTRHEPAQAAFLATARVQVEIVKDQLRLLGIELP